VPDDTGDFLRKAARDAAYALAAEGAAAKAQALAEVHRLAKECGASDEQLGQITSGFPRIADSLVPEEPPKRKRRLGRRKNDRGLPSAERPQLPPGR
jgi:hypothetical protein